MMKIPPIGAKSQKDNPPTAIVRFNQFTMSCSLNRMKTSIAMSENRIVRTRFESPPWASATGHRNHMPVLRSPLGDHQIIAVVEIVQTWCFGETTTGSFPDTPCLRSFLSRLQVNFTLINAGWMTIG